MTFFFFYLLSASLTLQEAFNVGYSKPRVSENFTLKIYLLNIEKINVKLEKINNFTKSWYKYMYLPWVLFLSCEIDFVT